MADFTDRTIRLLGEERTQLIRSATVAVFGIGGVGSYALEAVARAGFNTIIIADFDRVDITNINRQLITLHSNIGVLKTELAEKRVKDINPECTVHNFPIRICSDTLPQFNPHAIDVAIDCIDSIQDKIALLEYLASRKVATVSSMGAALKLDPSKIETAPLQKTTVCPLAKKIRKAMKDKGISDITAVYSTEASSPRDEVLGSISYLPSLFGLHCAAAAIDKVISPK